MKNYHALFIIIIAILLVGGGVLIYKDLTKSSNSLPLSTQQTTNLSSDNRITPTPILIPASAPNINNETAKLTVKDCGLIEYIDIIDLFASNQTNVSLKCMDNALINCQPAKVRLVIKKEGEGMYEIKGKEGQNCLINGPFSKSKEYQTCRISPDAITEMKTALKQDSDSNGSVFLTTILGISMNAAFVPSDFVGSSHLIGPVEIVENDATGKTTTSFYNYDCR